MKKLITIIIALTSLSKVFGQSSISPNGIILFKGKPFFPFGCYGLYYSTGQQEKINSIKEMSKAGMNVTCMVNADNNAGLTDFLNLLDTCSKYNVNMFMGASNNSFLKYRAAQSKNKPALIGYTLADDADDPGKTSLDECKTVQQEMTKEDPTKITHLTLTGWNSDRRSKASEFIAVSDICSYQIYPICQHKFADFSVANSLSETYKRTLAYVVAAEKVNKPFIMLPQTFSWAEQSNSPCYPTVLELRNMLYTGLAAGVKGIISYDFSFDLVNNQKLLWKEFSDLGKDVLSNQSYFLEGKLNRHNITNEDLVASSWQMGDTTLYVIANTSYSNATKNVLLQLPSRFISPKVKSINQRIALTIQLAGNNLNINLASAEVQVFKMYSSIISEVTETANASNLHLYPNPAQGLVTVANAPLGTDIKLLDLQGREHISQKVIAESTELNLQALPQGMYLVKVGSSVQKLTVN